MTSAPAWVMHMIDQRLALMEHMLPADTVAGFGVIMTTLTEPGEGADEEAYDRWERTCDNCGTYCPDDVAFFTGQLITTLDSIDAKVIVTFGACERCKSLAP